MRLFIDLDLANDLNGCRGQDPAPSLAFSLSILHFGWYFYYRDGLSQSSHEILQVGYCDRHQIRVKAGDNLPPIIETVQLGKIFKLGEVEVEVLNSIELTIEEGEFISIMGPSGSGKSTLLYLIGGLDKPTSGQVWIKGRNIAVMRDKEISILRRRTLGFVFQFYNLIPNLNVEDNIMLPVLLDGKRLKTYRRKLDAILETVGLADRRRHTPRELSGGQQQRVAIARALINEPDIILADEPIGNLDTKTGMGIMELLQRINCEQGKTIVQVTHSQEAAAYSQRIINLRDGKVWEQ
jgi:putative ABC transport system ATP-binding protein